MTAQDLARTAGRYALVVIDGCDGTGKTTLSRQISTRHGHRLSHASLSPADIDLFAKYHGIITGPGPLVLDRSFVSELVYGPLERGMSRLSLDQAAQLATIVGDRRGVLVHLTGQPERIIARLRARDGQAPSRAHVASLTAAYTAVFDHLAQYATVLTTDTTASAHDVFPGNPSC